MCIYWVKHYTCGHFADSLQPTLQSHCREYDSALRYWHDQVDYRPLEAVNSELGTLPMPQPCRPIWPIRFPGDRYLPLPNPGSGYPRGLARPRAGDNGPFETSGQPWETFSQMLTRENLLMDSIGGFQEVATHQDHLNWSSSVDIEGSFFFGDRTIHTQPPFPRSHSSVISGFTSRRNSPDLLPNVILEPHPTGCLRTPSRQCSYDPINPRGLQCPWLLSLRTPWVYPPMISAAGTGTGIPQPYQIAHFLADFSSRGAPSMHMQRDASGSQLIRVGLTRDMIVERIPQPLYSSLLQTVLDGPTRHVLPHSSAAAGAPSTQVGQVQFQRPVTFPVQGQQQPSDARRRGEIFAAMRNILGARHARVQEQERQKIMGTIPTAVTSDAGPSRAMGFPVTAPAAPAALSSPQPLSPGAGPIVEDSSSQQEEFSAAVLSDQQQRQQQYLALPFDQRDWVSEGDNNEDREWRNLVERDTRSDI